MAPETTAVRIGTDRLLGVLPDPVVVVDPVGRLIWANAEAEVAFGLELETMRGRLVSGLVHPDDVVTALESLATVQHKPLGSLVAIRVRGATGSYRHYEVRGRAFPGDDGDMWVALVLRDVTDRRQWDIDGGDAARLRAIVDHAPGITMVLGPDGRIRSASRALTSMLGRSMDVIARATAARADRAGRRRAGPRRARGRARRRAAPGLRRRPRSARRASRSP